MIKCLIKRTKHQAPSDLSDASIRKIRDLLTNAQPRTVECAEQLVRGLRLLLPQIYVDAKHQARNACIAHEHSISVHFHILSPTSPGNSVPILLLDSSAIFGSHNGMRQMHIILQGTCAYLLMDPNKQNTPFVAELDDDRVMQMMLLRPDNTMDVLFVRTQQRLTSHPKSSLFL